MLRGDCLTRDICKINEQSEVAQCTRLSAVSTVTVRIRAANSHVRLLDPVSAAGSTMVAQTRL
jgi:hypothetical protein